MAGGNTADGRPWNGPPDMPMPMGKIPEEYEESVQRVAARYRPDYAAALTAALDMLGARLMLLVTMFGTIGLFSYAAWQPTELRLYIVIAYAVLVLWPMAWLHIRKG